MTSINASPRYVPYGALDGEPEPAAAAAGVSPSRRLAGRAWSAPDHGYARVDVTHVSPSSPAVEEAVREVETAVSVGIMPTRVSQGSSGSYFVRDRHNRILGIFKPKDEEPYGDRNPKWVKYLHKTLFPCCFGRACLVANQGYISEAAAYVVDQHCRLNIVPPTNLVEIAAPTFNYPPEFATAIRIPPKLGSLQLFVSGYVDALTFLRAHEVALADPASPLRVAFQAQFERLVVLDYIIRNTDRGTDNWLVRVDPETGAVSIAAIDNGLAFPFKHPDGCRAYPFAWAKLPFAAVPFSSALREQIVPVLTREASWDMLVLALREVFEIDSGFDAESFDDTAAVLRGQMANVIVALEGGLTPLELLGMPPLTVTNDPTRGWLDPLPTTSRACFATW